jgi:hypothetical protein
MAQHQFDPSFYGMENKGPASAALAYTVFYYGV